MKNILRLLIIYFFIVAGLESKACGNAYYFKDRHMPMKNGFIDYQELFLFRTDDERYSERGKGGAIPYFHPVGAAHGNSFYKDEAYSQLRDTLLRLIGSPKEDWKISNLYLAEKARLIKVDYKLLSDFAWALAKKNELKTAETILVEINRKHPNEYNVVANLGTVYELLGKNQLALQFIEQAISIDPGSHYGSEWLHVNILKSKMNSQQHANRNIFGLKRGKYTANIYKEKLDNDAFNGKPADSLMIHLAYQLHERMYFISQKDKVISEMLSVFMQLMIHRGDCEWAAEAGRLVLQYNTYNSPNVFNALSWCLRKQ